MGLPLSSERNLAYRDKGYPLRTWSDDVRVWRLWKVAVTPGLSATDAGGVRVTHRAQWTIRGASD